ncbi:MAG: right-handed parallel beta-helix repeat-containing protein, partial [Acidobacteriota bacterium]
TWGRFLAYQTLAQTLSPSDDDWHLYFDPARQAFEPAVWDPDGWHTDQLAGDTDSGHLHEVLMAVDDVQRARHRTIEDFFAQSLDQAFLTEIDQAIDLVEPAIRVDPHLVSGFDVIEPQQVLGAILGLRATIARGFDEVRAAHLADRYRFEVPPDPQTRATDTSRCPRPKGPPLVWSGTKVVDEVLLIENDLVIQPGTTVRLAAGASIVVEGRLDAEGTAEAPIRFGPAQEQQEPWGAIVLRGAGANGSALRHCELSLGSGLINEIDGYSAMLSVHDVQDVSISDCHFRDNRLVDDMLRTVYSKVEIRHCHFDNALFDAIDLDISHGTIEGCVFDTSGNDALDLMTSEVLVAGNRISGAGDKGISVGEQTRLFAVDNLLADNRIGIESKDGSEAWVYNSTFRDNTLALHAYLKNWRYGRGGTIHLQYSTIEGIGDVAVAARRSAIRIGATTTSIAPGSSKRIEMTHEPLSSEVPAWAQPFISRVVPSRQGWQSHGH